MTGLHHPAVGLLLWVSFLLRRFALAADHELALVNHLASQNHSAVKCVMPLIVQCRRFWYAYQHEGEIAEGARAHMALAQGIATGCEAAAVAGANQLMDYLERFARRVIDN